MSDVELLHFSEENLHTGEGARVLHQCGVPATITQRAISACLHNNILFRRLCAFYVQSFFAEKQTLKT